MDLKRGGIPPEIVIFMSYGHKNNTFLCQFLNTN